MTFLTGGGSRQVLSGVKRVYAHSTRGGDDRAVLHGAPGAEQLTLRRSSAELQGSRREIQIYCDGFRAVTAYLQRRGGDAVRRLAQPRSSLELKER